MFHALIAQAEQAPQQPEAGPPSFVWMFPVIILLGYLLLFRPAQREQQQRRALITSLKKNDKIVNSGGIIGIVDTIKDKEDEIVLKGGLRITKSSVVRVLSAEETVKES